LYSRGGKLDLNNAEKLLGRPWTWEIFFMLWFDWAGCTGVHLRSFVQVGVVTSESLATAAGAPSDLMS